MYKDAIANSEDNCSVSGLSGSGSAMGLRSKTGNNATCTTPIKRLCTNDSSPVLVNGDDRSNKSFKKKRKDRDYREKVRIDGREQRYGGDSNLSEDCNLDVSQIKRKRHEAEMLTGGVAACIEQKSSLSFNKRQNADSANDSGVIR